MNPAAGQILGSEGSRHDTSGGALLLDLLSFVFIILQPEYGGVMMQLRNDNKAVAQAGGRPG